MKIVKVVVVRTSRIVLTVPVVAEDEKNDATFKMRTNSTLRMIAKEADKNKKSKDLTTGP